LERDAALADFDAARAEWDGAFAKVPDGALGYLKEGDDYALGGLQVHVNWVLTHYTRILEAIVGGGFRPVGPKDSFGESDAAGKRARAGLNAKERLRALYDMERLHAAVLTSVGRLKNEGDWTRKAAVVYGEGQDPYPTSPEDIVGWLTDHYREHVPQSGELISGWESAASAEQLP
jgi:hypothetical protein